MSEMSSCPLCLDVKSHFYHQDRLREYWCCARCDLVYVPDCFLLSAEQEKAIYDQHRNSPDDMRYRRFLSRLWTPLSALLKPGSNGLDFGCGPGPTLSVMAAEDGHEMALFDAFYFPEQTVLQTSYNFVTSTEVVEHLHDVHGTFQLFQSLLKSGAYLGIMTKLVINRQAFSNWHYKNDPTHVRFFSPATFRWIEKAFDWQLIHQQSDVTIFQKKLDACAENSSS